MDGLAQSTEDLEGRPSEKNIEIGAADEATVVRDVIASSVGEKIMRLLKRGDIYCYSLLTVFY